MFTNGNIYFHVNNSQAVVELLMTG